MRIILIYKTTFVVDFRTINTMSHQYLHSEQLVWLANQNKAHELFDGAYLFRKLKSGLSIHGGTLCPKRSLKSGRLVNRYANLIVLFDGHLRFAINEQRYDIAAGTNGKLILVTPDNKSLFTRFLVNGEASTKIALKGIEQWFGTDSNCSYPSLYKKPVRIEELNANQCKQSQLFLKQMMAEESNSLRLDYSALQLLDELWSSFADDCAQLDNRPCNSPFSEFVKQLSDAYNPRTSSQELANRLHLSVRTLQRRIQQHFGCTLSEWMHHEKMVFALQSLNEAKLSISEISYECGYNHVSNFTQAFKQYFQRTPAEIKKQHLEPI